MYDQLITTLGKVTRKPDLIFRRCGMIDITSRVTNILGIQEGDILDIARDSKEYYLYVQKKGEELIGKHTAQCRPANKGQRRNYMRLYSKALANVILSATGGDKARLTTGEICELESIGKAIPIITRNLL